jgi:IMP dehydrogenase
MEPDEGKVQEKAMKIRDQDGLTFDDVLLVPHRSRIASRSAVDTSAQLTRNLRVKIPIISANMDTVTESTMAILLAQLGGLGAIHRFIPIERQAAEVERVKRAESFIVESPASILPETAVGLARQLMEDLDIGGLMVQQDNELLGIVTARDLLLAPDSLAPVSTVMTGRDRLTVMTMPNLNQVDLQEARRLLHEQRIEKLPILNLEGQVIGLVTAQDIVKLEQHPLATKDPRGRLRVAAAVGVRPADIERAAACVAAGADVLVLDIAHGHADHALDMVRQLKTSFRGVDLIAGNVATAQGVIDLAEAGADSVKVGVGSGSICITRIVTGFGVPQLTAISDCAQAAQAVGIPLIADGGIRNSGDLTKALAAGADTVMIGSLLAGTEESPGASVVRDGRRYKIVRGMASLSANADRKTLDSGKELDAGEWEQVVPEGVEAMVPYRGAAADILYQLVGGLRSGLSYAGAANILELRQNAEFIRISPAGERESGTHDVEKI